MLINCVAYQNGKKIVDIPVGDISDYIARPDTFVWVALQDATAEELDEMQREFGLHPLAVEDARHGHQRPKIEEYGGASLFCVLHLVEPRSDNPIELNIGEVDIFTGSNYVLSVRNRSQRGFLGYASVSSKSPSFCAMAPASCFTPSWTRWSTGTFPSSTPSRPSSS